ncbi:hypothetical protein BH11BAC2_BH11BAC2_04840 [soil metagenome]
MKIKQNSILILFFLLTFQLQAQRIKVYFNHPVNTAVSSGVSAIYVNQALDDTLIAYINRAQISIDVAVYNYSQSAGISNIATAINAAYNRGVNIRWIYNSSSSNSGVALLDPAINTLGSPSGANYTIMHNKFMIVDAASTNPLEAIVWTGSSNWGDQQFNDDENNVIIIQDQSLAQNYTIEFNEMWGGSGLSPNLTNSKFGSFKTNNTQHQFTIDGKNVELFFSPSDGTSTEILQSINSANQSLYFGIYTFTESTLANAIVNKIQNNNVYALGIIDQFSISYQPYSILSPVMNTNLIVYNQTSIYHNKMLIVDPCLPNSDPQVVTGSHNWSISANTQNDENTLIIHDDTITNIYYQSFYQDYANLGGIITSCNQLTGLPTVSAASFSISPNPITNELILSNSESQFLEIKIYSVTGSLIEMINESNGEIHIGLQQFANGLYLLQIKNGNKISTAKFQLIH